jgi:hypothetical protein
MKGRQLMSEPTSQPEPSLMQGEYEAALDRYERISEDYPVIRRAIDSIREWADQEFQAAAANLSRFEDKPGIPKREYRRRRPAR